MWCPQGRRTGSRKISERDIVHDVDGRAQDAFVAEPVLDAPSAFAVVSAVRHCGHKEQCFKPVRRLHICVRNIFDYIRSARNDSHRRYIGRPGLSRLQLESTADRLKCYSTTTVSIVDVTQCEPQSRFTCQLPASDSGQVIENINVQLTAQNTISLKKADHT